MGEGKVVEKGKMSTMAHISVAEINSDLPETGKVTYLAPVGM